MSYRWLIGNGEKVRFWVDNWLGSLSLAIQYWKLYRWLNEKNMTVANLWDGSELKCTFCRWVMKTCWSFGMKYVKLPQLLAIVMKEDSMV